MFVRFGVAICGAMIFVGCSFAAMAEAGIASVYELCGSAYCQWRTRSAEWSHSGASHAAFWHPRARDK